MNWNNSQTNDLFRVILELRTQDDVRKFFRDLMTEEEILEFGRRWKAAQMLEIGVPYTKIVKETGLSSTTVARVSKWLNSGMGGYKLMLSRLTQESSEARQARLNHHHTGNKTLAKRLV